jgi:hypothetical protein
MLVGMKRSVLHVTSKAVRYFRGSAKYLS